jgi:hypothetical protein
LKRSFRSRANEFPCPCLSGHRAPGASSDAVGNRGRQPAVPSVRPAPAAKRWSVRATAHRTNQFRLYAAVPDGWIVETGGQPCLPPRPTPRTWAANAGWSPRPGPRGGSLQGRGFYPWWAMSMTSRLLGPGPARVNVRSGSRARTPTPRVVRPSKLPAQATWRSVRYPVTFASSRWLAGQ